MSQDTLGYVEAARVGLWVRRNATEQWRFMDQGYAVENDAAEFTDPQYINEPTRNAGEFRRVLVAPGTRQGGSVDVIMREKGRGVTILEQIIRQNCGFDIMLAPVSAPGQDKGDQNNFLFREIKTGLSVTGRDRSSWIVFNPDDERVLTTTFNLSYADEERLYSLVRTVDTSLSEEILSVGTLDKANCGSVQAGIAGSEGCESYIVAGAAGLLQTRAANGTWTDLNGQLPVAAQALPLVAAGVGDVLAVGLKDAVTTGVVYSRDAGASTFIHVTGATPAGGGDATTIGQINAMTVINRMFVAVGNSGELYRSFDAMNWVDFTPTDAAGALNHVHFQDENFGIAVGDDGKALLIYDRLNRVDDITTRLDTTKHLYAAYVSNGLIFVAGQDAFFAYSDDLGRTWYEVTLGFTDTIKGLSGYGTNRLFVSTSPVAGAGKIYETFDPTSPDAYVELEDDSYAGNAGINVLAACEGNKLLGGSADGEFIVATAWQEE